MAHLSWFTLFSRCDFFHDYFFTHGKLTIRLFTHLSIYFVSYDSFIYFLMCLIFFTCFLSNSFTFQCYYLCNSFIFTRHVCVIWSSHEISHAIHWFSQVIQCDFYMIHLFSHVIQFQVWFLVWNDSFILIWFMGFMSCLMSLNIVFIYFLTRLINFLMCFINFDMICLFSLVFSVHLFTHAFIFTCDFWHLLNCCHVFRCTCSCPSHDHIHVKYNVCGF